MSNLDTNAFRQDLLELIAIVTDLAYATDGNSSITSRLKELERKIKYFSYEVLDYN